MTNNPDIYLLYESGKKISFTLRIKVQLDEPVDQDILKTTAQEAFERFPYYRVKVGLDPSQNYCLIPNDRPLAVLKEEDRRIVLGSEEVNDHLFVITYRNDTIWFSCSHSPCGGFGVMFWVKTTLYQYLCKKYGPLTPPGDIKLPGTPVSEAETFFPDAASLPTDEPMIRYEGGDCNLALMRTLLHVLNPFSTKDYYYEIEIPAKAFMKYAVGIDASPNTVVVAMMYKAMTRFLKEKEGTFISGRVAADYRKDIGADESYRDFVRFIHVKYGWDMKNEPISKLNLRTRGAFIKQNQPELSYERYRKITANHEGIDAQPTLKEKRGYAAKNSLYRNDPRDAYTISYVGRVDYGEMEKHIKSIYNITDGDLMLEINALKDTFHICFQVYGKNRKPLERFLEVLEEESIPYKVSDIQTRYLPMIKLPDA
ncbi:MAG: hypothetical protein IIZ75_07905 [Lachnospiraceae bacterium]|nr:hypothetical protein [Lachnospiraceae bacterium]